MPLTPSTKLGNYQILESIGAGGMGEVYVAEDPKLSRKVALKVLPPEMAARPERLMRFEREAKAVAALNHPNIVTIYSVEELALAMKDSDRALELMRAAVELESQTDKSGLSPGRVLPAHEQLGDMLAELDRPREALAEYQASMDEAPRRFNTYLGAARAADGAGEPEMAREYYEALLELASEQGTRAELAEARDAI